MSPPDYIPPIIALPLTVILWAAFLYPRRHKIAEWLGYKEKP